MDISGHIHSQVALPQGIESFVPIEYEVGGPHSRCGRFEYFLLRCLSRGMTRILQGEVSGVTEVVGVGGGGFSVPVRDTYNKRCLFSTFSPVVQPNLT
jgi:hypothetical protein